MKRILSLLLILFLLLSLPCLAEEEIPALCPIRENELWGYMNRVEEVVIEHRWLYAYPFSGDTAIVRISKSEWDGNTETGWWGDALIDRSGQYVFAPVEGYHIVDFPYAYEITDETMWNLTPATIILTITQNHYLAKGNGMNKYHVENFTSKSVYHAFLSLMLAHSDAFSLVYFQYDRNEEPHENVRRIMEALSPYEISNKDVTRWPGTITMDFRHIYNLRVYRINKTNPIAVFDILDVLETADSLWDWDYPKYPMDLCFYKNGFAWFASSAHEQWNALYTDEPAGIAADLESIGLQISQGGDIADDELFHEESLRPAPGAW